MDRKMFGKRVNKARKDHKLTGDKLAEACNVSPTYLRQIESGVKLPSLPVFVTICQMLEVSPSYLLADSLDNDKIGNMDIVFELWKKATPAQIRLISAVIHAALESMDE